MLVVFLIAPTNNNNNAEVVSTATSVRPSIVLPAFKDPADMCFYFHSHFASNKQLQKKYIALSSDKVVTSSGSGYNMYYMCICIINVSNIFFICMSVFASPLLSSTNSPLFRVVPCSPRAHESCGALCRGDSQRGAVMAAVRARQVSIIYYSLHLE